MKKPKKKCCTSKPRCSRCPIRLLHEGQLPPGLTVRRRKLVKIKGAMPDVMVSDKAKGKKGKKKKGKRAKAPKVDLAA